MRVSFSTINFRSDYSKGKESFNKLSETEKFALLSAERARQEFNKNHAPSRYTNLSACDFFDYVSLKETLENSVKTVVGRRKK